VREYLAGLGDKLGYVVLNTGLHDTSLNDSSPDTYEDNMRW